MVEQKKLEVIKAAENLFATKGFTQTTVADISRDSGIHDASIYAYFNNKKNILFSIYGGYLKDAVKTLKEHFQGMKEPGPKLRKAIWHYLYDMKQNPNFAKVWIMANQVGPDFYNTEYYKYQNEYTHMIFGTIKDGQKEGVFRSDITPRLIRNLAMGASAFTIIDWIMRGEAFDPNTDSDRIYSLVIDATGVESMESGAEWEKALVSRADFRRTQILSTAIKVFAEKGFSNSTISQIAKEANLGDATLYEYFDKKESILLDIAEPFMQDLISGNGNDVLFAKQDHSESEKRLRSLIWRLIWQLWSNVHFSRVLFLELFRNDNFYSSQGYKSYLEFIEKIRIVLQQGQEEGVFAQDLSFGTYINLLIGALDQYLLSQFVLRRPQVGIAELNDVVDALVRAIKIPKNT